MKMSGKLKTIAASVAFGGMLAVASMAFAQEGQTPSRDGQSNSEMMPGGMSGGMMSGDMHQMMANCQKMMQGAKMSGSSGEAPSSGSPGSMPMSGDRQKMMGNCQNMMNSLVAGTPPSRPTKSSDALGGPAFWSRSTYPMGGLTRYRRTA
jgi:hypothetical protein